MNGDELTNSEQIPIVKGSIPLPRTYKLASQQIPIRGVVVDNSASTTTVLVYPGDSPHAANFFTVAPGQSRGFSIDGTSSVYVAFSGTPIANGTIYIEISSKPQRVYTQSTIITQGSIPLGAVALEAAGTDNLKAIVPGTVMLSQSLAQAQTLYVTYLRTWGLSRQKFVLWELQFAPSGFSQIVLFPQSNGDIDYSNVANPAPLPKITSPPGSLTFNLTLGLSGSSAVVGTLNFSYLVQAYYI